MNAKTCKRIRKNLRDTGVDVRDAEYQRDRRTGTISLTQSCGRSKYHWVKQAAVEVRTAR